MTDIEKLTAQLEALNKNLAELIARMPPYYAPPMYYPPQPSPTTPVNPYFPQGPWVTGVGSSVSGHTGTIWAS